MNRYEWEITNESPNRRPVNEDGKPPWEPFAVEGSGQTVATVYWKRLVYKSEEPEA